MTKYWVCHCLETVGIHLRIKVNGHGLGAISLDLRRLIYVLELVVCEFVLLNFRSTCVCVVEGMCFVCFLVYVMCACANIGTHLGWLVYCIKSMVSCAGGRRVYVWVLVCVESVFMSTKSNFLPHPITPCTPPLPPISSPHTIVLHGSTPTPAPRNSHPLNNIFKL